ncbi:MAG TPA: hypothetical protein VMS22_06625 [Candidatus Eisenbacteria bacterium]|nr:hypothetical protein [Candidatus Eisenbacteria bacterium]
MLRRSVLAGVLLLGLASGAWSQAILTKANGGDDILIFPTPGTGLPAPTATPVTGLPSAPLRPHGVTCIDDDTCLVGDFLSPRVFVVRASTASVIDTIDTTATYTGRATLAVNNARTFVLAVSSGFSGTSTLAVIPLPLTSPPTIGTVPLPDLLAAFATEGVAFDASDRAYVCHGTGVSVLDPPYTTIAFTIPLPSPQCVSVAVTPDGTKLLVPELTVGTTQGRVRIFTAPLSAMSTFDPLDIAGASNGAMPALLNLSGIVMLPDASRALVTTTAAPNLWSITAPFSGASVVEPIALPASFNAARGFEDVGISPDGQLAILGGGGDNDAHTAFVRAPFTTAGATVFDVAVAGGRGNGAARFLSPVQLPPVTTTTLPGGAEDCGNCLDDDGNGLTDAEDPSCCTGSQRQTLTLRSGRLKPGPSDTTALKLKSMIPGLSGVDLRTQALEVQLRGAHGELFCATLPAGRLVGKKRAFRFKDRAGTVARGLAKIAVKLARGGAAKVSIAGKRTQLTTPAAGSIDVTLGLRSEAESRCAAVTAPFRAVGKKGVLRAP